MKPSKPSPHDFVREITASTTPDDEKLRLARKVLKSGSDGAIRELFDCYRRWQADTRWGASNPLVVLLGPLRVQAVRILNGPAGPDGSFHEAALTILWHAAKPSDIPMLTRLLKNAGAAADLTLLYAIDHALDGCTAVHVDLIEALERFAATSPRLGASTDAMNALGAYLVSEAIVALERLALLPDVWRRAGAIAQLVFRDVDRHVPEARALVERLRSAEDRPELGAGVPILMLEQALDWADDRPQRIENEARARVWLAAFDHAPDEESARLAEDIDDAELPAQEPLLERLSGTSRTKTLAILRLLEKAGSANHAFFRHVWPLTSSSDPEIAARAVAACIATGSDQAIARLERRKAAPPP
jgi:hypothetical protein